MKICFCIDYLGGGGAERVMSLLANKMSSMGHCVFLIEASITDDITPFYSLSDKVKHIYLRPRNEKYSLCRKIKLLRNKIITIDPDIVVSFKYSVNIYTAIALLGTNIPHVVSERNNPYSCFENWKEKLFKKMVFRHSSGCVFQTEYAAKYYFRKNKNKYAVIFNPISDNVKYHDVSIRKNVIVNVGRLEKQKNTKLLIESFELLWKHNHDAELHIYGEGSLKSELESYVLSLESSKNIVFLGNSKTWAEDEFDSKMFVLSSNYEGIPNSLMESMALGIPSISTDCPCFGPRELIKNMENGILVPVNDLQSLFYAMQLLFNNMEIRNKISQANSLLKEKYSLDKIAKEWLAFLNKIIRNKEKE